MFSVTNDRGFVPQSEQFEGRDMVGEDIKAYKIIHTNDFALKSATYRVSWEFTCKTTKILLLYIFLGHNRNVVNTKFPYPIKRLEVIRRFNQKSMAFNQSLS